METDAPEMLMGLALRPREWLLASHDLLGVIRVNRSECLRLRDIGRGLRMVDQVYVPGAIQGHEYIFDALGDALKEGAHRGSPGVPSAAHAIMMAPARKFSCLSMPSLPWDFLVQFKPDWHQRVVGGGNNVIPYLYRCAVRGERVKGQQRQGDPG